MRISDWSADVCSSDLSGRPAEAVARNIEDGGREIAEILDFRHSIPHLAVRPKRPTGVHVSPSGMWVPALRGFAAPAGMREDERSEERRVGKECVSTCRSRWSPYH